MNKTFKKLIAFVSTIAAICASSLMMVSASSPEAEAATATTGQSSGSSGGSIWPLLIFYVAIFGIFGYFMIYRPNKKRKKQEEELRASIMLGAQVVSIGGICGTIVNIKDDVITIESSIDRTLIEFKNWAIREIKNPVTAEETAIEGK